MNLKLFSNHSSINPYRLIGLIIFGTLFNSNIIFSQTYEEIMRMRNEYEKLQNKALEDGEDGLMPNDARLPEKIIYKPSEIKSFYDEQLKQLISNIKSIEEINTYVDSIETLEYFGYDYFFTRDSIEFWQNLPIPPDYVLGAGDELIISLWGEVEKVDQVVINRDGEIFIENVGIINISGNTLEEAKPLIKSRYEKTFSTLKGLSPKSFMNISLGELKGLNVYFFGAVNSPGLHTLHPFSTILSGLIQSGGIDTTGSLREISIFRNNKKLVEFDLYNTLSNGQLNQNIRLLNQDIIFVKNRISKISISGEIYRPGIFELKANETFESLLGFAGGLKPTSLGIGELTRITGEAGNRKINQSKIPLSISKSFIMQDGDSLHISKLHIFEKTVNISGQVLEPRDYSFSEDMRVSDLLFMAGGFNDSTWWNSIDLKNASISRINKNGERKIIKINLIQMMNGDQGNNPYLEPFDELIIPRSEKYIFDRTVTLSGEVKTPGYYRINNTTLNELINRAGGFTARAFKEGIEITRDTLNLGWSDLDLLLNHGDQINVPKRTNTVKVVGAVNKEGYYMYKPKQSSIDYIENAGGFTVYANRKDIFVILPNGNASRKTFFNNPKVLEGSTIVVSGSDLVVSQPDYLLMGAQMASILGSLSTVFLILNTAK